MYKSIEETELDFIRKNIDDDRQCGYKGWLWDLVSRIKSTVEERDTLRAEVKSLKEFIKNIQ